MQLTRSVYGERIGLVEKTEIDLELLKTADCPLNSYGNYEKETVSFKTNF